jgi:hypothetical protein
VSFLAAASSPFFLEDEAPVSGLIFLKGHHLDIVVLRMGRQK